MTMFVEVNYDWSPPTKQEVAGCGSEDDSYTEPSVVRHEDQHKTVADKHL